MMRKVLLGWRDGVSAEPMAKLELIEAELYDVCRRVSVIPSRYFPESS
jgi:hypothetical protein